MAVELQSSFLVLRVKELVKSFCLGFMREIMLYKSCVAYPPRAESCQEAQFPFPIFITYTIIIGFIFPPVLKVCSAALVHLPVDLHKLYYMKIWTFI